MRSHHKGNGPDWLVSGRILRAFQLAEDGRGRRAYVAWLEARATNNGRKVQLVIVLRTRTTVSNAWIADKLAMGHPGSVSRSVSEGRADKTVLKRIKELENVLICVLCPHSLPLAGRLGGMVIFVAMQTLARGF